MKSSTQNQATSKLALILSMVIFGTIGIFRRYIPLPSGLLAMLRGIIGASFLLCIMLIGRQKINTSAIKSNLWLLISSGVLIGFNWILLFEAYRFTSVSTATLCYYMAPVFVLFASPLVLKERLTGKQWIAALIALVGMVLVSGVIHTDFSGGLRELTGVFLGLGAALLYASVILINKRLKNIGAYDKTLIQLSAAGMVLIPYTLLAEQNAARSWDVTAIVLLPIVGVVHTGFAYAMYFGSMKALKAQTVAIYSYIDPIVAVLLSALLLNEQMQITELIGAVLILGATLGNEWIGAKSKNE